MYNNTYTGVKIHMYNQTGWWSYDTYANSHDKSKMGHS